jgi:putative ABC transport system permease protein
MAIVKIAWRNLVQHRVKTLIIGIIISLGITILVIGNSMIDTAGEGIKKNYTDNYTGHLIITGETDMHLTLFGAMNISSFNETIPTVPRYFEIISYLESYPYVHVVSGQAAGRAQISFGENIHHFTLLFGIEPYTYLTMFPDNIELLQGDFLKSGKKGLLLSEEVAERLTNNEKEALQPGDKVLLTGISSGSGVKIRELPVTGIFRFKHSNVQLDMVSLIDIDTLRSLNGMTLGAELEVEVLADETDLIDESGTDNPFGYEEEMFGDDMIISMDTITTQHTEESLSSILGNTNDRVVYAQTDSGAWHFILIKLTSPAHIPGITSDLNRFFNEKGILAKVSDWKSGAGPLGEMADTLKIVFNAVILIIAVVAVIIIMNTLVISITERIQEIGTMRALGARKGFVRLMIIIETTIISLLFGLIGIILGTFVLGTAGITGITAPNIFFEVIFGGKVLYPVVSFSSIVQSLLIIVSIGIISSLYPVSIALKIQPVAAIQTE